MRSIGALLSTILIAALAAQSSGVSFAHGESVTVQPDQAKTGDTITVKGNGFGSNRIVEIRLVSMAVDILLGSAKTDTEGNFTAQFSLQRDLKPGSYQIRAVGEETATTEIRVLAAEGMTGMMGMESEVPVPRR